MAEFDRVWDALAKTRGEAELKATRAEMMYQIQQKVKEQGWNRTEAGKHLGITQPRASDLMTGKMSKFSLDALVQMAGNMDLNVTIGVDYD